jgi:SAM-dependent methyltransferase
MDYTSVTEAPGTRVTREAASMLYTRYAFAAPYCRGRRVLEVACGAGQGLGYLGDRAGTVVGGDYTEALLARAHGHYRGRVRLIRFDAQSLPFRGGSFDVVLLYEALYYLARPDQFLEECARVLSEHGALLICTVNKDWSDFNPSPLSTRYFSAPELTELLGGHGFQAELYGAFPVVNGSLKGRVVSLIRRTAVVLHVIPRTMKGKEALKRVFLGPLVPLPAEVHEAMAAYCAPVPLARARSAAFKVLFAVGRPGGGRQAPRDRRG